MTKQFVLDLMVVERDVIRFLAVYSETDADGESVVRLLHKGGDKVSTTALDATEDDQALRTAIYARLAGGWELGIKDED